MEQRHNAGVGPLLRPVLASTALFALVCGLAYPPLTTGIAQVVFPTQADGSLIERDGRTVGSALIGQQFTEPRYFHPRPSATVETGGTDARPYNGAQSAGTNHGPTNAAPISSVEDHAAAYREENGLPNDALVPVDALTTSGSGLDPHISVANARLQTGRVAGARDVPEAEVRRLVEEHTAGRLLGVIGKPGVKVLELNLALDELD